MSEVKDGCCIIDALEGIDATSVQVGRFTDNFDKVKFLLGNNFTDYTVVIITDINGIVEIIHTDGKNLVKETDDLGNTTLLWYLGANVTSQDGIFVYQIAAYKKTEDTIEKIWYSQEGRLVVTDSIETNGYSTNLLGAYPNLLTRLLTECDDIKTNIELLAEEKVSKEDGKGLSRNDYTDEEKEKLLSVSSGANVNVQPDWDETDEMSDAFIKNKPDISSIITNITGLINEKANQSDVSLLFEESAQHYRSYEELNEKIGDIDSALDRIIAIQNSLLGVSE